GPRGLGRQVVGGGRPGRLPDLLPQPVQRRPLRPALAHAPALLVSTPDPAGDTAMAMKLELVPIPVTDVDRAKAFYTEQVGFHADLDERFGVSFPGGQST